MPAEERERAHDAGRQPAPPHEQDHRRRSEGNARRLGIRSPERVDGEALVGDERGGAHHACQDGSPEPECQEVHGHHRGAGEQEEHDPRRVHVAAAEHLGHLDAGPGDHRRQRRLRVEDADVVRNSSDELLAAVHEDRLVAAQVVIDAEAREQRDHVPEREADQNAHHAADVAEHDGLHQELSPDAGRGSAEGLAQADLAGPLRHRHQHHSHDADAAHHQRDEGNS